MAKQETEEEEDACPEGSALALSALHVEWVVLAAAAVHLLLCPYTKVEESFNVQAVHDILYHRTDLTQYDHLEFPGVVPRTFVGPLVLAALSAPLAAAASFVADKCATQLIVRLVLGSLSVLAFYRLRESVERVFGRQVAVWLVCITVSQFHFMFYLTRTLPNMMAMPLALLAVSCWMDQKHGQFIWSSAAAIILFRSELAGLLGMLLVIELFTRRLPILRCIKLCVPAGVALLLLTVAVDSLFWRRLVWPEGEVLWFNLVLNKSSEWGTSPALWYWYSALPRALAASLPLVGVGLFLDRRVRLLAAPALLFVAVYSLLAHKELRFIIYVVPLLNVSAARACHALWENRHKSTWRAYLATGMCCHLLLNVAVTALLCAVSRHNYPGGAALARAHQLVEEPAYLHVDVYAAQTGVTRFQQSNTEWRYNKTEDLVPGSREMNTFSHLLVEAKNRRSPALKHYQVSHTIIDSIDVFSHIQFNYANFPPLRIRTRPAIFILANNWPENIQWPPESADISGEKTEAEIPAESVVLDSIPTGEDHGVEHGATSSGKPSKDRESVPDSEGVSQKGNTKSGNEDVVFPDLDDEPFEKIPPKGQGERMPTKSSDTRRQDSDEDDEDDAEGDGDQYDSDVPSGLIR